MSSMSTVYMFYFQSMTNMVINKKVQLMSDISSPIQLGH